MGFVVNQSERNDRFWVIETLRIGIFRLEKNMREEVEKQTKMELVCDEEVGGILSKLSISNDNR